MASLGGRGGLVVSLGLNDRQFRRGLARSQAQLGIFSRQLNTDATVRMRRFGRELDSLGTTLTRRVSVPLALAGGAAARFALRYESSITSVSTLTGVPIAQVRELGESVRGLATEVGVASTELNRSLLVSVSAGNRGAQAVDIVNASARAAAIGMGELDTVTRAVTVSVQNFGAVGVTAARATDVLLATVQQGNFDSAQLANVWGQLSPLASGLGLSVERLGANYAQLSLSTGDAALSSTQLQAVLRAFVRPSAEAERALDQVGLTIEQVRLLVGSQGLAPTLAELESQLAAVGLGLQDVFSDSQALIGAQTLARDVDDVASVLANIEAGAGGVDRAFEDLAETAEFQLQQALVGLQELGISVGGAILPAVTGAATTATGAVSGLTDAFSDLNSATQSALVGFAAFAVGVGPALRLFGRAFIGSGSLLGRTRGAVSQLQQGFTASDAAFGARSVANNAIRAEREFQANLARHRDAVVPPPTSRFYAAGSGISYASGEPLTSTGRSVRANLNRLTSRSENALASATAARSAATRQTVGSVVRLGASFAQLGLPIAAAGAAALVYSATLDDQRITIRDNTDLLGGLREALEDLVPSTRQAIDAQRQYLASFADQRAELRERFLEDSENDPFTALARERERRDEAGRNLANIESGQGFARFLGADTLAGQGTLLTEAAQELIALQVSTRETAGGTLDVATAIADLSRDANEFALPTEIAGRGQTGVIGAAARTFELGVDVVQSFTRADVERILAESPALRQVYESFRGEVESGDNRSDVAALSDFVGYLASVSAFAETEQARQTEIRGLVESVAGSLDEYLRNERGVGGGVQAEVLESQIAIARDLTGNWEDAAQSVLEVAEAVGFTTNATETLAQTTERVGEATRASVGEYNSANNALTRLVTTQTSLRDSLGLNEPVLAREEALQDLVEAEREARILIEGNRITDDPTSENLDEYNAATIDQAQSLFAAITRYTSLLGEGGDFAAVRSVIAQQRDTLASLTEALPERAARDLARRLTDIQEAALNPGGTVTSTSIVATSLGEMLLMDVEALRDHLSAEPLDLLLELQGLRGADGSVLPLDEASQQLVDDIAGFLRAAGIRVPVDVNDTPANETLDFLIDYIENLTPDPISVTANIENVVTNLGTVQALLRETYRLGGDLSGIGGLPLQSDGGRVVPTTTADPYGLSRPGAVGAERARILASLSPTERAFIRTLDDARDARNLEAEVLRVQALSGTETDAERLAREARESEIEAANLFRFNYLQERGLQRGGIVVDPTVRLIGEGNEPEAVVPLSRAREFGFAGGTTVNVIFQGTVNGDEDSITRTVIEGIRNYDRQNGSGAALRV